jgi:antitoxin (DNA-binding transcriptional repressor) of toxin-antitoxin stability system
VKIVNVYEAKVTFSKLLANIEAGEEIIIARAGKPVAKLSPYAPARKRTFGEFEGLFHVPENFDDPLSEDVLFTKGE